MICVIPSGVVNRCPVGHLFLVTVAAPAHLRYAPMYGVTSKSVSCGHSGPDGSPSRFDLGLPDGGWKAAKTKWRFHHQLK